MMAINLCADHFSEWYDGGMPCDYCKQQKRIAELKELLHLIRDDLRMRSEDGVLDLSNFIVQRMDKALRGEEKE